ncbi:helix-turn-helix domain-containing protein [Streptomyces sp. HC44]|uniref:Helix-turn-helix domain-containing protein n=1 Tax=Streptomyces scabichelini TaxID=2711217 RepID=A0A6G4V141_9ACTN|nr:helix-turn-helix domain-containing protein [Streptomyces scabichelini]NGO07603.1 helix-turn-helix domain-containing protein [Streptomyces scabichelini]
MAVILSTESVAPTDRLAYWHDAVWKTFVPLDVTASKDQPFSGSVATERLGHLRISTVDADGERVRRSRSLIAESADEYLLLGLQTRGTGVVVQDGRTAVLGPGEFALYDTTRPYTLDFPDRFETVVFQLPRRAPGLSESDLRHITGVTIGADQGLAALLVPFLSRLAAEAGTYRPEVGDMLARNAGDLLATVVIERLGRGTTRTDAAQQSLLLRIRTFIDAHLADPALSPEAIAAAHHISVRHLQRLFQAEGATVGGWIRRRRLEECRRELGRPRRARPTVAAVAHRWGFVSPAHFSRAFRAAYGMSPREWQAPADETGA